MSTMRRLKNNFIRGSVNINRAAGGDAGGGRAGVGGAGVVTEVACLLHATRRREPLRHPSGRIVCITFVVLCFIRLSLSLAQLTSLIGYQLVQIRNVQLVCRLGALCLSLHFQSR